MKHINRARVNALRDALYYLRYTGSNTVPQYRAIGRKTWKDLPQTASTFNLKRYDYRTVTRRVWMSGNRIECSNGGLPKAVALRILNIAKKRQSFYLGGYDIRRNADGGMTVGCSTFSKEDVAHARQLLKA